VDDGVGCADEGCDELVDGGEEVGYGVGDGHFGSGGVEVLLGWCIADVVNG